jgi:hypothetical protein
MTTIVNITIDNTVIINKKQLEFRHTKARDTGVALSLIGGCQLSIFKSVVGQISVADVSSPGNFECRLISVESQTPSGEPSKAVSKNRRMSSV